jgi:ABC-2 type transport system permease protein
MTLFLRLTRLAFQQQLTYRAAILSGLATNFFFALLKVAVTVALYGNQTQVNGLSLREAITFVAISQGMIAFLFMFGTWDVMGTVYTGSIGSDLLKPLHLFTFWMARDLGRSIVNLFFRGFLLVAIFALVYPVVVPGDLAQWLALVLAMALAWLVNYAWRFLVNLAAFWTPDARGIGRIAFTFSALLSGFIMPLRLYPDWFASLCQLTPFPALLNTPVEVYLGVLTGKALWLALLNQGFWVLALAVLCEFVLRAGVRRLVIQGG